MVYDSLVGLKFNIGYIGGGNGLKHQQSSISVIGSQNKYFR